MPLNFFRGSVRFFCELEKKRSLLDQRNKKEADQQGDDTSAQQYLTLGANQRKEAGGRVGDRWAHLGTDCEDNSNSANDLRIA